MCVCVCVCVCERERERERERKRERELHFSLFIFVRKLPEAIVQRLAGKLNSRPLVHLHNKKAEAMRVCTYAKFPQL
jgi:hypothetical protein